MGYLRLGPGRDVELGVSLEAANKRAEVLLKNDELTGYISKLTMFQAEGVAMANGTNFTTGDELAVILMACTIMNIAILMEKGVIPKRLLKTKQPAEGKDDSSTGYM